MGFTPAEVTMLKFEWANLAKDYRVNGMCVFQNLFRQHPDDQKLFEFRSAGTWDKLNSNVRLMCHAASVMKAVGKAVDCAASEEALEKHLCHLGSEHGDRKVVRVHFEHMFPLILDQLVISNGGMLNRPLWQKFFGNCVDLLAKGTGKPVKSGPYPTEQAIRDVFDAWDANKDGALDVQELTLIMNNLDAKMTEDDIKKMVAEADEDKDGKVQFNEFLAVFRKNIVAQEFQKS